MLVFCGKKGTVKEVIKNCIACSKFTAKYDGESFFKHMKFLSDVVLRKVHQNLANLIVFKGGFVTDFSLFLVNPFSCFTTKMFGKLSQCLQYDHLVL
jgi:hypothetical protein